MNKLLIILNLLIMGIFIGCGSQNLPSTNATVVVQFPTATSIPTLMSTNTPNNTATPIIIATSTNTPTTTNTPTQTSTPTLTFTPTITPTSTYVIGNFTVLCETTPSSNETIIFNYIITNVLGGLTLSGSVTNIDQGPINQAESQFQVIPGISTYNISVQVISSGCHAVSLFIGDGPNSINSGVLNSCGITVNGTF